MQFRHTVLSCSRPVVISALLAGACLASASCADSPAPTGPLAPAAAVSPVGQHRRTAELAAIQAFHVDLHTSGPLRPGAPIVVTARAVARRQMRDARLALKVLDVPPDSYPGAANGIRDLGRMPGPMSRGADRSLTRTISFNEPGYYRILASIVGEPEITPSDTSLVITASATLWIVIDANGGRLTNGFDPAVIDSLHLPLYGAYGPFRTRRAPAVAPKAASVSSTPGSAIHAFGTYKYVVPDSNSVYVPVPAGTISAECVGYSSDMIIAPDVYYPTTENVGSSGQFDIGCPAGVAYAWDHIEGTMYQWDSYVKVGTASGSTDDFSFYLYDEDIVEFHAGSNYRARVFTVLHERVPVANSRFQASRSVVLAKVSDSDTTFSTYYDGNADEIHYNATRLHGTDGYEVILHEYGHSFQFKALAEPAESQCDDQDPNTSGVQHFVNQVNTMGCAFTEGFAEFFAAWIGEDWLGSGFLTDAALDDAPYRTVSSADGFRVEGAVAGFLYDLVDNAASPNSSANTSRGQDDDGAAYPGSVLRDIIADCRTQNRFGSWMGHMDGADQFIACAEGSVSPLSLQNPANGNQSYFASSGRAWVGVDNQGLLLNASVVRRTWLFDLYNQGALLAMLQHPQPFVSLAMHGD